MVRLSASLIAAVVVFTALIFWPAGRLDWPAGWIYMAIVTANFAINIAYLKRVNPALIGARTRVGPGTKRWDIVWGALFGPVLIATYIVAGFDAVRYEWSNMSPGWWALGCALFVAGMGLFGWSMGVNPFFEKTVRIQSERGHHVIDTGPYAVVRHPGYVGFFGWCVSVPLLLGSWWAFVPAGLSVIGIVVRTALEDRTLRAELDGYEEYTTRTRYRLIPGLW